MTKVVFHQGFDFANVDMAEFLGGSVDLATATPTQFTISEGNFDAVLHGAAFNPFTLTGTINEVDVLYKNRPLFTASNMNVSLGNVWDAREDGDTEVVVDGARIRFYLTAAEAEAAQFRGDGEGAEQIGQAVFQTAFDSLKRRFARP